MINWNNLTGTTIINLNYLTGISIISLGVLVFLAGNNLLNIRMIKTNRLGYIILLEESKFMLPFVLRNYYMHIINWSKIKLISLFAVSFWYNNTERKEEKEKEKNRQLGYLRLKFIGLSYALILYALLILIWHSFSRTKIGYQYKPDVISWLSTKLNSSLFLGYGIDGLSLPFVLLVVFIMPIVYFSNWTTVDKDDGYYTSIVGLLEWFLITVFVVIDLIMFYIFFESILPPLFVMIGLYGASQKFRAGYYLFLYTLMGSLFMLMVFVKMGGDTATTYFEGFGAVNIYTLLQEIIWVVLFVSFSVKTPLVPVHIWLPLAHSDANVSGSIVLASIVLKLALYGFIRILIGIFTFATSRLIPFFFALCCLSVLYSSFTTIRQFDLKVLVAYSSIAHMASSLLGTFSDTLYGLIGSIIFGLAHGFVSPALFILVGAVLYDRCGSRIINYYRGLSNLLPFFALLFLLFVFGNMGVPLTGNFIGEFLSLLGAYQQNIFIASIGATSVILSAVYSIFMYNRVTSGALSPFVHTIPDIFRKEFYIILPLLILTLLLGIYPCFISYDVEFGLSTYLLFTVFPVTLMNKSGKSEVNSNPLDVNSKINNLDSDSNQIIHNNTPSIPESILESSSASNIVPNNTSESQETASISSDNEGNASEDESSRPKDIYFGLDMNLLDDESISDSDDKDSDSVKESKSVNEESEETESDGVKSDSENDHEYEEIDGDDDDSDDSNDEKIKIQYENTEDDNSNENNGNYNNNNNGNEDPPVVNEEPHINERPSVEDEDNLTDASIITNYSPSDSEDRVEAPSSCSSYGSDAERDDHSPVNLQALTDFITNMFNSTNNNPNNDNTDDNDNNDNDNNDNNDNNENNDNNDNNNNNDNNDNNSENEGDIINNDDDKGDDEDPLGLRAAPPVPNNTPETQFTVPNHNNVPIVRRPVDPLPSIQENRNEENRNEEINEEEDNGSEGDPGRVNENEHEDLYGTPNSEPGPSGTNENNNSIGENKDSKENDKNSNSNLNETREERDEVNQILKNIKNEEQGMPFIFQDMDFINYWIKFIKNIESFSYSLKELLGFLISTGLSNISTCLFIILLMNKIYKIYSIHIRPIIPVYQVRFILWKMKALNFISIYIKK